MHSDDDDDDVKPNPSLSTRTSRVKQEAQPTSRVKEEPHPTSQIKREQQPNSRIKQEQQPNSNVKQEPHSALPTPETGSRKRKARSKPINYADAFGSDDEGGDKHDKDYKDSEEEDEEVRTPSRRRSAGTKRSRMDAAESLDSLADEWEDVVRTPRKRAKAGTAAGSAGLSPKESGSEDDHDDVPRKRQKKKSTPRKKPVADEDAMSDGEPMEAQPSKPGASNSDNSKSVEETYQRKTQLEHVLLRPDTYIGTTEAVPTTMWVVEDDVFVQKEINYVQGLYKIFDEILVNAADNKVRDPSMNTIKVSIDREKSEISIYNNGEGIPIEVHPKENLYVPELIFGHLLTSSNFDDSEKKVTGGRNGYGAKLCNIFSKKFVVETGDSEKKQKYHQAFSNNMSQRTKPKITKHAGESFTRITFVPDLERFQMRELDDGIESLFRKRVYDLAGCLQGVKIILDGNRIKVKGFKDYVSLYTPMAHIDEQAPVIAYERCNDRWEVACFPSSIGAVQVSFVNGICTSRGGTHVNHVLDQIVGHLLQTVQKKIKRGGAHKNDVKKHIAVFVNCLIENPTFDTQTKEFLTSRSGSYGSRCTFTDEYFKKVAKTGVIDKILTAFEAKAERDLKKNDGQKRSRLSGFAKLDDANLAGTSRASECTLILTEGDSAKALAVAGLSVVGRDKFGVFPLRGKLLNVRETGAHLISANQEITALKRIMGLQQGKVYHNVNELRYGHIMIMADQDHDGSHIKGLIINFLDRFWPSLLKIPGFLQEFVTPIVKAVPKRKSRANNELCFYTIPDYERWKRETENNGQDYLIKYYKGLGTSTSEDAKKYFTAIAQHRKSFKAATEEDTQLIDMAFSKKRADERKDWLYKFEEGTSWDHKNTSISISDFVNKELILFSLADCQRSIANVVDGLKPGQRKILFCSLKRKLKNEIKVPQLAGYISEHSAYHHGEQSLFSTIIGMAQNFVGANNLALLEPRGQFGTRLQGGKDSASPRYLFTMLNPIARVVFHPEDDCLLRYLNDDGQDIEPEWCGKDSKLVDENRFKVSGVIRKTCRNTLEILELPIGVWTQSYKELLEAWANGDEAKKEYKEYNTESKIHFTLTLTDEQMANAEQEGFLKTFKLVNHITTSNLVCFDSKMKIRKYQNIGEIFQEFHDLRLEFYTKRKAALVAKLESDCLKVENQLRFVESIIYGRICVQNRKKPDIIADLKSKGFLTNHAIAAKREAYEKKSTGLDNDETAEDDSDLSGYNYLLNMAILHLTHEKVAELRSELEAKRSELEALQLQTELTMWKADLEKFLESWETVPSPSTNIDMVGGTVLSPSSHEHRDTGGKGVSEVGNQGVKDIGQAVESGFVFSRSASEKAEKLGDFEADEPREVVLDFEDDFDIDGFRDLDVEISEVNKPKSDPTPITKTTELDASPVAF
ncbi:hypothetical protein HDU96_011109 [Phlyctochytrium bullatum]|nr:hypothetical protein HDU96_011109 [Phlyctochytrium bullatum]